MLLRNIFKLSSLAMLLLILGLVAFYFAARPVLAQAAPFVVWPGVVIALIAGIAWLGSFAYRQYCAAKVAGNEAQQSSIETTRKATQSEFERAAMMATVNQMSQNLVYPNRLADMQIAAHAKAAIDAAPANPAGLALALPLPQEVTRPLLEAIANCPNVLVVGGKGSGKTTLLQHLNQLRQADGRTLIFDSHSHPAKWTGERCKVIGNGRNYADIWRGMMALVELLHNRYKEYSTGEVAERQHETIVNVIDEFTLLPKVFKSQKLDVQSYSLPLLTEGRKVALDLIWGIHSDRAAALGLEGAADIKECFDAVVYLKNVNGDRYALIDYGEGIDKAARYTLPGPFVVDAKPTQRATPPAAVANPAGVDVATEAPPQAPPLVWTVAPEAPEPDPAAVEPTEDEMGAIVAFVTLRDSGEFSWNKATQAAFGEGKFGSNYIAKLKRTLEKFSVDYSSVDK